MKLIALITSFTLCYYLSSCMRPQPRNQTVKTSTTQMSFNRMSGVTEPVVTEVETPYESPFKSSMGIAGENLFSRE